MRGHRARTEAVMQAQPQQWAKRVVVVTASDSNHNRPSRLPEETARASWKRSMLDLAIADIGPVMTRSWNCMTPSHLYRLTDATVGGAVAPGHRGTAAPGKGS